jgi:hypothetical protein
MCFIILPISIRQYSDMSTVFVVKNTTANHKTIRVFGYPIEWNRTRDLLTIPKISEADIRHSLLPGNELHRRIAYGDLWVDQSNIDLLQFDDSHRAWLIGAGVRQGIEVIGENEGGEILTKDEGVWLYQGKTKMNFIGPGFTAVNDPSDEFQANITISAGLPGTISIGSAAAIGTADALARADHVHAFTAPGAPENINKSTALTGTSTFVARADHKHDIETGSGGTISVGSSGIEGTSTSLARADHTHTVPAGAPVATGISNSSGSLSSFSRSDHIHETSFSGVQHALGIASSAISLNEQNITSVGTVNGIRDFGTNTTDPLSPTPHSGDVYFNTAIGAKMIYDESRGKWLSAYVLSVFGGASGNTAAGSYLRGIDGVAFTDIIGFPVNKGTLLSIYVSMSTNSTSTIEVLVGSTVISTIPITTSGTTTLSGLNADFEEGVMKFRNISSGNTITNIQVSANYKRRA